MNTWASATILIGLSSFYTVSLRGQTIQTIHDFVGFGDGPAELMQAVDGMIYGETTGGGPSFGGTAFRIQPDGSALELLHAFSEADPDDGSAPLSMIQGIDGRLYGATKGGGAFRSGTLFTMSVDGSTFRLLHSFNIADPGDGSEPAGGLVQLSDGTLYGTTDAGGPQHAGTVFRINPDGTGFQLLHVFVGPDGSAPTAALVVGPDGLLYGTTYYGGVFGAGVVFRISSDGLTFQVLHSFDVTNSNDGARPQSALTSTDVLYGTTRFGGTTGNGIVFKIAPDGSQFTVLHAFDPSNSADGGQPVARLLPSSSGDLFGTTTGGTVFALEQNGANFRVVHTFKGGVADGFLPEYALCQTIDGKLYGTTHNGGPANLGTLFQLNEAGTAFRLLYAFGSPDTPAGLPTLASDGNLYGVTQGGGDYGSGSVFELTQGGAYTTRLSFSPNSPSDGLQPASPLLESGTGKLFGTTFLGGDPQCAAQLLRGCGTVFTIDADGSSFRVLHVFSPAGSPHGFGPSGLLRPGDGNLYGTTFGGGAEVKASGTAFALAEDGAIFSLLHDFDPESPTDGAAPEAGFVLGNDAFLYGTTSAGGAFGGGTVFKIRPEGSSFQLIHSFSSEGILPTTALLLASDGLLYGATQEGGPLGFGMLFRLSSDGSLFQTLHTWSRLEGYSPSGPVTEGVDGYLYGLLGLGGPHDAGTAFRIAKDGTRFQLLHSFSGVGGSFPIGALGFFADGNLFGAARFGGLWNSGTVFRLLYAPVYFVGPTSGPASGGTAITISGGKFQSGLQLTLGGQPVGSYQLSGTTQITVNTPALTAGTMNDIVVTNIDSTSGTLTGAFLADFIDVPQGDPFHRFVESIFRGQVTAGYGNGFFGRDDPTSRDQSAVFLLRSRLGYGYQPQSCVGVFQDVPCPGFMADWIEDLWRRGIAAGCSRQPALYCPSASVTRAQASVLLLRTLLGSGYTPPPATGMVFQDVPASAFAAAWIEDLYDRGIAAGCSMSPRMFCPGNPVTRGQMAVLLVTTFSLP